MAAPRYALVVRTHFWDDFVRRQLERLRPHLGRGDLFLLIDVTRGDITPDEPVATFKVTDPEILRRGYIDNGDGSIQWFSGDVPLYLFRERHPDYDYYVQLEYDVNVAFPFDDLVDKLASETVDFVALTMKDIWQWFWVDSCLDFYPADQVEHQLICMSAFSNDALRRFETARLAQAERFRSEGLKRWPMCEGYLSSEARRQGMNRRELSDYVETSMYNWYPPLTEGALADLPAGGAMHPVLDDERFIAAVLKHEPSFTGLVNPFGWRQQALRRLGARKYLALVASPRFRTAVAEAWGRRGRPRAHVPRLAPS